MFLKKINILGLFGEGVPEIAQSVSHDVVILAGDRRKER